MATLDGEELAAVTYGVAEAWNAGGGGSEEADRASAAGKAAVGGVKLGHLAVIVTEP